MLFFTLVMGCALLQTATSSKFNDSIYMVTMSSQVVSGNMETVCVHVHKPTQALSLELTLQLEQGQLTTLLQTRVYSRGFYNCLAFKVPSVLLETVATLDVSLTGKMDSMSKRTKILIRPSNSLTLIRTDKPVYKPGQKVGFRVVSLTSSFATYNQMYQTVEIQDPNSNRIAQWLNISTVAGFLDLSHPTTAEAPLGRYTITAWSDRGEQTSSDFELKEYVLPKFEVTVLPLDTITILDTEATLEVCGLYSYGKPVLGLMKAEVCRKRDPPEQHADICMKYNMGPTNQKGCATQVLDLTLFELDQYGYQDLFDVQAELQEIETRLVLKGSGSLKFTSVIREITFEGVSSYFRPDGFFQGKIKMADPNGSGVANEMIYLILTIDGQLQNWTLITDNTGMASFSLDTTTWKNSVSLEARPQFHVYPSPKRRPDYLSAYHDITAFYSKSSSFVSLQNDDKELSCDNAVIFASYLVKGKELDGQRILNFFYMVMSRGSVVKSGSIPVPVVEWADNRGTLRVELQNGADLSPVAQVVVYAIMPNGVIVADSLDFSMELCFMNKVSLQFSSSQVLPGSTVSLIVKAQPGSLCSVWSIDRSVLMLKPAQELHIKSIFNLLPIHKLSGYNYNIQDPKFNPCIPFRDDRRVPTFHWIYKNWMDIYTVFRDIGMKIMTNSDVQMPLECIPYPFSVLREPQPLNAPSSVSSTVVQDKVRLFFPETWIWDLLPVGKSGSMKTNKQVPDTITTWPAGAFCTSSEGFGLATNTALSAFQPFFVSLTLPYSVVRGEKFTLQATVFLYSSENSPPICIMAKVTLSPSNQFSIDSCDGCKYQMCLCSEESRTFQWHVSPSVLGEVSVEVKAEAMDTNVHCGGILTTVPTMSSVDTVVQTFLVEAEGISKTTTYNALLCPAAGPVEQIIPLEVPAEFVIGSAKASLSVLGDLMGRSLRNMGSLLDMPSGCGEQNMLRFAPIVYILEYLQSTGQLTPEIQEKAVASLQGGYQNELNYKHKNGSYSAFGERDESGNTWLTTFVMKSFGRAVPFTFIDPIHITEASTWLASLQKPDGCIASVGKLFHNDMQGGVSDDVSLTAYITAALLELGHKTTDPVLVNCLRCLDKVIVDTVDNLYTVALLSNTFSLAHDQKTRHMLITNLDKAAKIEDGTCHWEKTATSGTGVDAIAVEMTSYVLLALLTGPVVEGFGLDYAAPIVRWLVKQQNANGAFSSTQDTVVALQALAKYSAATFSSHGAVTTVVVTSGNWKKNFIVDQQNRLLLQEQLLEQVPAVYKIRAEGKRCVLVQITLSYNIPVHPDVSAFMVTVDVSVLNGCAPKPTLNLLVTVSYTGQREQTNMVLIDIKLLSGFIVDKSLHLIDQKISKRVEEKDDHVIIYVDQLKRLEPMSYRLFIVEEFAVKNLQPAAVKVYDYYKIGEKADTEYRSPCTK